MSKAAVRSPIHFSLLTCLAFCILSPSTWAKDIAPGLPVVTLRAGNQSIQAEVAATEESRQKGLMFREKMGRNEGMLFVFTELGYHAMWMRNTPLPLSVAFIDEGGKILSIHEMQPHTEVTHQAAGPSRYALEMNTGWFKANKVSVGDPVRGLEKAPKPR